MIQRGLRSSVCLAVLLPVAAAQDFDYPDFSSVAGLTMNGNSAQAGNVLRVAPSAGSQTGSVFYDTPMKVTDGFSTQFTFQFTALGGGGADGMTFILHNSVDGLNALGDDGSGMGYSLNALPGGVIENSLAVEFDTWLSGGGGDVDNNHVSIHTGGIADNDYNESFSLGRAPVVGDMSDGAVHTALIRYSGGVLEVYVDDLLNPLVAVQYDFTTGGLYANGNPVGGLNLINGDSVYVGFTAATGGAWENHDVLSWSWSDANIGMKYCGPANVNSTGAAGDLAASGSEVVAQNDLTLLATSLPPDRFAFFLNSQTAGFTPNFKGSQGNLCIDGAIGFHYAEVGSTGGGGLHSAKIDLTQVPTPGGAVAVVAGETWNWQCWFRDQNPGHTSNLTDAISITFQ